MSDFQPGDVRANSTRVAMVEVPRDVLDRRDLAEIKKLSKAAYIRLGQAGPGLVPGPGLQSYDLSVAKNFRFQERYNLRFQTDFFNAFNVANFSGLNVNVSDKAFGTLSSAYPPRNLQMQLKFQF